MQGEVNKPFDKKTDNLENWKISLELRFNVRDHAIELRFLNAIERAEIHVKAKAIGTNTEIMISLYTFW